MKIKNKKIVITGGNGRFARVLKNALTNKNIYFPDKKKLNITNLKSIEKYLKIAPPSSLLEKIKLLPMLLEAAAFPPKIVGPNQALCQEIVLTGDDIDLGEIPILQCWPNDAGRFITFPTVIEILFHLTKKRSEDQVLNAVEMGNE